MNRPVRHPLFAALLLAPLLAFAADGVADVASVRAHWDHAMYGGPADARAKALEAVADEAAAVRAANPRNAEALIWEGIVLSSWAGEKGGLGALGLAKKARADFEAAIEIDPAAAGGSAYTSLGSLYYQVPGWPIGFGDDDKARELLEQGLRANPDGIDANYFYGDFLRERKDWEGAERALAKALAAPPRPGRELADAGRRAQAQAALAEVRAHLVAR